MALFGARSCFVLLLLLGTSTLTSAQAVDSLLSAAATAPEMSRTRLLVDLQEAVDRADADAARASAGAAASRNGLRGAVGHLVTGALRAREGAFPAAMAHFDTSAARAGGSPALAAQLSMQRGRTLFMQGDRPGALDAFLRALRTYQAQVGQPGYDARAHAAALVNAGNAHSVLGNYDAALGMYGEALPLVRSADDETLVARITTNVGSVYLERGEIERAQQAYLQALQIVVRQGERVGAANILGNLALTSSRLGRPDEAVRYAQRALEEAEAAGNPALAMSQRMILADALLSAGRSVEAAQQGERVRSEARTLSSAPAEMDALEVLSYVYAALGRPADSRSARTRAATMRDSLSGVERATEAARLQEEFGTEQREAQITRLESQRTLQATALRQQRLLTGAAVVGLLLTLLLGALAVRARRLAGERNVLAAQLAERERVAGELHDTLMQSFTGVSLQVEAVAQRPDVAGDVQRSLEQALSMADGALLEAREAVWALRSPADGGLAEALRACAAGAAHASGGPPVSVHIEGAPRPLAPAVETELLRIGQEAIRNAVRHARADAVDVCVRYSDRSVHVQVTDDGAGFDAGSAAPTGHWGLRTMRERAARVGACLDVSSTPGTGTVVRVEVPS